MNEVRRARLQRDIEQLAHLRERIDKIRDDEEFQMPAATTPELLNPQQTDQLRVDGLKTWALGGKVECTF